MCILYMFITFKVSKSGGAEAQACDCKRDRAVASIPN